MRSTVIDKSMFYGANQFTFDKAKELRSNMTLAELVLWKRLKNRNLFKVKFRRQHPINRFIVDFYCHECKLAIEIDGDIHLEKDYKEKDSDRDQKIERFGIKILRFSNDQIILNNKSVTDMIILKVAELTPLQGGRGVAKTREEQI
jgi:very-short-patch-repair endonuclease